MPVFSSEILAKFWKAAVIKKSANVKVLSSKYRFLPDCQIPGLAIILETYFGSTNVGTLVEIGANDGKTVSNTLGLLDYGWCGILVEAIPELAEKARNNFIHLPNVHVVNIAIAGPGESEISMHLAGLLSTARTDLFDEYKELSWAKHLIGNQILTVPAITLDELLGKFNIARNFELLVIDVEGYEGQVLQGFNLNHFRPRMIIVELSDNHSELFSMRKEHSEIHLNLISESYIPIFKDHINTIYVDKELYVSKTGKP